ncbi:arginase family protein [Pseudonocardia eucalypti]|uniref:Arginase family protein n=1 Tax=Pseudonocardia eucalypti TaxID=648755 RepID=A0ABP9PK10_9PSEU
MPFHQDQRLPDGDLPVSGDPSRVEPDLPAGDVWQRLAALYDAVADAVAERAGGMPTVVSGDCLVTLGTLTGLHRAGLDPALVWFDAHGDVHTLHTTTSGYLGGLALRLALGAHEEKLAEPLGLRPLPEERAVLVDARDLDPAEVEYLASARVRRLGVSEVEPALLPDGPILLHVDVDVIDRGELPGLRFPAAGGPSSGETLAAVKRVLESGRVVGLDIACPWHPGSAGDAVIRRELLARLTG